MTSEAELRELLGEPVPQAVTKERSRLHQLDRLWLAASPFCLVATAASDGSCDVSPKGDPPGFTLVLDETTIAIPERPGNRRADGFRNILSNPHVGLIYVLPGRGDTLRINGRARLVRALLRAHGRQGPPACPRPRRGDRAAQLDAAPTRAAIAHTVERPDESLDELQRYYGSQYADGLYGSAQGLVLTPTREAAASLGGCAPRVGNGPLARALESHVNCMHGCSSNPRRSR